MNGSVVTFPPELLAFRGLVEGYVEDRIREFAHYFAYKLNPSLRQEQVARLTQDTLAALQVAKQPPVIQQQHIPPPQLPQLLPPAQPQLRLVLKHDCESSGCGDADCILCQFNPNRLCTRNLKPKYLIDDNLKAKCGAAVRVELNDDSGQVLHSEILLEAVVLSSDKYKELCMLGPVTHISQLRSCVVPQTQKALLRREGGKDDELRMILQLERGKANLSELEVTTSSEALLQGKAPGFLLLIYAVDSRGMDIPGIQFVVSEKFVVTTKRVKQAIKSDIPTVDQHVSKLVHVGRATVDKLQDLRNAVIEEHVDIELPEDLSVVDRVGQFQKLVEMADASSDFKVKIQKLLKLSPEKWEEVAAHAMNAVVPDSRPRVWCTQDSSGVGLLFQSKHGAALLEHPVALLQLNRDGNGQDFVVPMHQLDPAMRDLVTQLRRNARLNWVLPRHPGWAIYWKDSAEISALMQSSPSETPAPEAAGTSADEPTQQSSGRPVVPASAGLSPSPGSTTQPGTPATTSAGGGSGRDASQQPPHKAQRQEQSPVQQLGLQGPSPPRMRLPMAPPQQQQQQHNAPLHSSTTTGAMSPFAANFAVPHTQRYQVGQPQSRPDPPLGPSRSTPFTSSSLQLDVFSSIGAAMPPRSQQPQHPATAPPPPPQPQLTMGMGMSQEALALQLASARTPNQPPSHNQPTQSLEMITSDDLRDMTNSLLVAEQPLARVSTDNWILQLMQSTGMSTQAFSALSQQQLAALGQQSQGSLLMPGISEAKLSEALGLKLSMSLDLADEPSLQGQGDHNS